MKIISIYQIMPFVVKPKSTEFVLVMFIFGCNGIQMSNVVFLFKRLPTHAYTIRAEFGFLTYM